MGWEQRPRGGRYYTRSRRIGGRVVREYVGGGLIGQLAAALDDRERTRLHGERAERRRDREMLATVTAELADATRAIDAAVAGELEADGYHWHRGEWRRRRLP